MICDNLSILCFIYCCEVVFIGQENGGIQNV